MKKLLGMMLVAGALLTGCGNDKPAESPDVEAPDVAEEGNAPEVENTATVDESSFEETLLSLKVVNEIGGLGAVTGDIQNEEFNITLSEEMADSVATIIGHEQHEELWTQTISAFLEQAQIIKDELGEGWRLNVINPELGNHKTMLSFLGTEVTTDVWDEFIPETKVVWRTGYFVDDFQMETDQAFIANNDQIQGTFNNSATKNGDLTAEFYISDWEGSDGLDIVIRLHTHGGRNLVQNSSTRSDDYYDITMRTGDGDISITGTMYTGGFNLFIDEKYTNDVFNALKENETVMFHIVDADRPTTNYLFTVETGNFTEVFEEFTN